MSGAPGRRRARRAAAGAFGTAAAILSMSAAVRTARVDLARVQQEQLARHSPVTRAPSDDQHDDWSEIMSINPNIKGWLTVEGTHIDSPVVQAPVSDEESWYLTHDVLDRPDPLGCPYLGSGSRSNGRRMLVFGHHLQDSTLMFSELADAWEQGAFETVGEASWALPSGRIRSYRPLAALRCDASYQAIQEQGAITVAGLRSWVRGIVANATARSRDAETLMTKATHILTLVTCSSDQAGLPWRTLVIFAA